MINSIAMFQDYISGTKVPFNLELFGAARPFSGSAGTGTTIVTPAGVELLTVRENPAAIAEVVGLWSEKKLSYLAKGGHA